MLNYVCFHQNCAHLQSNQLVNGKMSIFQSATDVFLKMSVEVFSRQIKIT